MSDDTGNRRQQGRLQNQPNQSQLQQQQQQFLAASVDLQQPKNQHSSHPDNFFVGYQPPPAVYDEHFDSFGNLRPDWGPLNQSLCQIGPGGMEHRWRQIRRMVRLNGSAYSAYGDPTVREKHLQLDPLPNLIPSVQWSGIESALKQRATLLNLMLADLYGPRKLLTDGVLPPDILFNHPHYQLPYHDLPTPGGRHLHFYAAELIRSPSGAWWVVADRTDSPGGSGFALENRIVISRSFPSVFHQYNVKRLAPYFIALREHLTRLAPRNTENPHIAILSAGAGSASYFEDSFLARYLGFTLVEVNDLCVRSGKVMLKTLGGLAPIDVIMRRLQGNSLDPLELGGGAPGIAGILQSIRDKNVAVVNAPGSGLVESPIFMAFMPRICKALMQTDLMLPGVATWWGGEPGSLELILDRIDEINLLPAFRQRSMAGRPNRKNSQSENPKFVRPETISREARIELVKKNPHDWVGQEKVSRSSAAVWQDTGFQNGFISMRTFLTASENSWHDLPGGLTRVSEFQHQSIRNPFEDGGAKDSWVLSDKPVDPTSLLRQTGEFVKPTRSQGSLPSRVADNLCWLGRFLERADSAARLLRAVVARLTGETDPSDLIELPVLIRTLALSGQIDSGYAIKQFSAKLPALEDSLPLYTLDHSDSNSLRWKVDQVVSLAARVRERLSNDAWRIVQEMSDDFASSEPKNCDLADLLDITESLIVNLAAFGGLANDSMTRTHAFRFLTIGRRLEHSMQITKLIKHCFAQQEAVPGELLEAVLEIGDSGMTYRSRYYANLQMPAVLDLLLIDETNPRSLAYQLLKLTKNLELLPGNSEMSPESTDQRLAIESLNSVRNADVVKLCESNSDGERIALQRLTETIEHNLPMVSTSISNRYLVHSGPIHQLISDEFEMES